MIRIRRYVSAHLMLMFMAVISPLFGVGQFDADFFPDTTQTLHVDFQGFYTYGSSVMDNQFMNKFLFGGTIDRADKDRQYGRLSGSNRLGADFNFKVTAEIPFDTVFGKPNLSLLVGVESVDHIDAVFGEELFRLTFDGNKQFAGQTIDIGNTNYNQYRYQYLSLGFINHKFFDEGRMAREGVIVNLIKGQEHQAITVPEGSLYTEELGREIALDINYVYNATDTANKGWKAFTGWGISTDLFTEFYLRNGAKIYMGVEDLGFIFWNKQSLEMATDSLYSFSGITIDNIFDLNDTILDKISKDSIVNSVATRNIKDDYSIALPTAIQLKYTKVLNEKWKINAGLYYKILSNYFPLIYSNAYYYVNDKLSVKIQMAYGGYGTIHSGMAIAKSFGNSFRIYVGTNNLEGLILTDKAHSNSGFVGIKKYF
ncbi:MAG: hypothetical protein KDD41_04380 [Flavobacteriales bacterium]|nr:hypothetical protein [Flavobacteriales bacterium]